MILCVLAECCEVMLYVDGAIFSHAATNHRRPTTNSGSSRRRLRIFGSHGSSSITPDY